MKAGIAAILILFGLGISLSMIILSFDTHDTTAPLEEQAHIQEGEIEWIGAYRAGVLEIIKIHDNKDNVTCWLNGYNYNGISCIPDHMLAP